MTSRFLNIKCNDCGNEQVVFERAASAVDCLACGTNLLTPTGGRAQVRGDIVSAVE